MPGRPEYILKGERARRSGGRDRAVHVGEVYLSAAITDIVVSGYKDFLSDSGAEEEESSETKSLPLLTTKLHRPPISQARRLENALDRSARRGTLAAADPGLGPGRLRQEHFGEPVAGNDRE